MTKLLLADHTYVYIVGIDIIWKGIVINNRQFNSTVVI